MNNESTMQRLDQKVIKAKQFEGLISLIVYIVINPVLLWLTIRFDWPVWIVTVAIALSIISAPIEIFVLPRLKYKLWLYRISDEEVELHHGYFIRKKTIIPMVKIQHIDSKQGPILKRYGLASITLSTAAGSHEIPGLAEDTADQVRRTIATLARITDEEI